MAYQIIWTAHAENDFRSIITYLKENWSDLAAEKFANKTIRKLEKIASMPYLPGPTSKPNVHKIESDKKRSFLYARK